MIKKKLIYLNYNCLCCIFVFNLLRGAILLNTILALNQLPYLNICFELHFLFV